MLNLKDVEVGDVYYRRIDGVKCIIQGFFYMHYNETRNSIVEDYSALYKLVVKHELRPENIRVLFHNSKYDTVENLFTSLYMGKDEWNKMQEYIKEFENADGLWSAMKIALEFPDTSTIILNDLKLQLLRDIQELPMKDKLYWTTQIENCKDLNLAQSLVEGLKKQLQEEYTQDDYDGQHAEEQVLWNEDDLVLNPGEKPKRFKLFK